MDPTVDQFRACPVGILTSDYYDNVGTFIDMASEAGHDFVATPMAHPSFRRVLHEDKKDKNKKAVDLWRDGPVFDRQDLILQSAGEVKLATDLSRLADILLLHFHSLL